MDLQCLAMPYTYRPVNKYLIDYIGNIFEVTADTYRDLNCVPQVMMHHSMSTQDFR